jgi:hypothetical protein
MTDKANDKDKLLNDTIKASIEFEELMDKTDFDSWLDGACLFNWNNISENDYKLLIEYLNDNFENSGIEPSQIEKSRDCKTISISTGRRSLLLKLNDEKTNANLEINAVSVRDFTVETEGDKLNVCFTDSSKTLGDLGQCDDPFKDYEKNKKDLEYICRIKDKGNEKYPKVGDKSSLERYLIYNLFDAKITRLEARICSKKEDEKKEYKEVLHKLLSALNALHNLEGDNTDKRWFVLLYNDLSICYAGLDNSSMSRGYAEEAMKIIEKEFEKYYKEFNEELSANNSKNLKDIEGLYFVSSKLYDLYTVALFNQALAEKHLKLNNDAERNFRKIIEYAERKTKDKKDTPLRNFNYYSALLNLSDLYMDLSRGREAIDLLHKVIEEFKYLFSLSEIATEKKQQEKLLKHLNAIGQIQLSQSMENAEYSLDGNERIRIVKDGSRIATLEIKDYDCYLTGEDGVDIKVGVVRKENSKLNIYEFKNIAKEKDIRYWKAYLYEIDALIDQSEYGKADSLLKTFKTGEPGFTLNEEHKVTSTGFKGLARYARCEIEKVKNNLRNNEKSELRDAEKIIEASIKDMRKREQTGLEIKTYKHLSEIDKLLYKDDTPMKYFIKYLSKGEIDNLKGFADSNEQSDEWIRDCKDLEFLENFTDQIIRKVKIDRSINEYSDLLGKLEKKIIKECDDEGQFARSEKVATKIDDVNGGGKRIKYDEITVNTFFGENAKGLTAKEIATSLYITEKEFDSFLFKRSKLKKDNHIVEMIVLRRWNSFSPSLFRGSTGSLGGGYFLRIKKNPYFSFSEIPTDEKQQKELLKHLRTREYKQQAKSLENAEYILEDNNRIAVTKNGIKIAILEIKNDSCYFKKNGESDIKIGIVKEDDGKLNIYSEDSDVENIVIDPGYNFIQNFCSEGFGIDDIDMIIVTHSHIDHCAELLPIMDLIYQINNRYEDYNTKKERHKKKVNLCLSKGVYNKFSSYIDDPDWQKQLKDVIILENLDKGEWVPFEGLAISAIPTPHKDLGGVKAIGLMIKIDGIVDDNENNSKTVRLGFTSDTPWYPDIKKDFKECDLLCVHLGSIEYQEIGYDDKRYESVEKREISDKEKKKKFEETYTKSDHLLFFGTERIISDYNNAKKDSLIIVGEFGEELKYGLRVELCKKLSMGKTPYLFSFSDITEGKGRQELLDSLRALDHSDLAEIIKGAEYSEKGGKIRITKNNKRIATLKIEKDLCYLEWDDHKFEIGVVKEEDDKLKIYKKSIVCLPSDIGQYIVIENDGTKKVRCNFCESFVRPKEIETFLYGREDAIHYICKLCNNTLSELQKHAFIKHRVTRH